jgi:hypothetical protein
VVLAAMLAVALTAGAAEAKPKKLSRVARAYVKALALASPAGVKTLAKLSTPGSNVDAYSRAFGGLVSAATDAGRSLPRGRVHFNDKEARASICVGSPRACIVFSKFKVASGKVADFVRDGVPFAGTLSTGDGSVHDALGSSLAVIGAYEPGSASLVVSVSVENGPNQLSFSYIGTYIRPDGHQVQSSQAVTPGSDLRPGSSATLAFEFPGSAPGGSVIVKCAGQTLGDVAETQMPVPVFQPSLPHSSNP